MKPILLALCLSIVVPPLAAGPAREAVEPFDYRGVSLLESRWSAQFREARDYYLSVPDDDILHGYRKAAGRPAPGAPLVRRAAPVADAIREAGLHPDFEYTSAGAELSWLHRRLPDGDLYFIANRQRLPVEASCVFRVAGRRPELWNPQTGETGDAAIYAFKNTRTRLPLHLGTAESVFVVFRKPAGKNPATWVRRDGREIMRAAEITRPPAPAITNNFTMSVWAKPDIDLRLMPDESTSGRLDETGKFYAIPAAEGDTLHGAGHATAGLAIGRNGAYVIERARSQSPSVLVERRPVSGWTHFAVTNLWANRLIGDESLPAENEYENAHWRHGIKRLPSWYAEGAPTPAGGRATVATWQFYAKDEPLLESGLLGPVRLLNPARQTFPAR